MNMSTLVHGLLLAGSILAGAHAFAGGLVTPFSMDSAAVMPKGVRSFRVSGLSTEVGNKYNEFGTMVPLADSFNKPVTWGELIDSQPKGFVRGNLKGGLESMGINMSDIAGDTRGMVNSRVSSTIPLFAYGVTEKITIGVGVPIVYSNVSVDTGWTANEDFQGKLEMLQKEGFGPKVQAFKPLLQNVVASKIALYGYEPLQNDSHTDIGDVNLGVKYQVYSDENVAVAIGPRVVIPTGRTSNINKVIDISAGDGQWDAGLSAVSDYFINKRFTLTTSAGYTYQIASTKAKRIPLSDAESISPDIDWNTNEDLGDAMGGNVMLKYKPMNLITTGVGYSLQYKDADRYTGSAYSAERYRYMSQETRQNMQAVQLAVSGSTIPLYQAGKFAIPADLSFSFAHVFEGRNVNKIDLVAIELAAYF